MVTNGFEPMDKIKHRNNTQKTVITWIN
jgi:hypothetical protein